MNTQKLVSILLLTMFTTTNIYSNNIVCINCVAKINNTQNSNSNDFKPFKIAYNTQNQDDPNYILPLDDNEATSQEAENIDDNDMNIILINNSETIEENNSIISGEILYACEDTEKQTLVCDNINKICECV